MKKSSQSGQRDTARLAPELHVGIFWVVDGKPLIDRAPLSEAEPYGDHQTHPRGHSEVWEQYQRSGIVFQEMEYEEPPRGRVMYNAKTGRFTLLADKCILQRKDLVAQIKKRLNLPKNTKFDTDSHYRCFTCLYSRSGDLL